MWPQPLLPYPQSNSSSEKFVTRARCPPCKFHHGSPFLEMFWCCSTFSTINPDPLAWCPRPFTIRNSFQPQVPTLTSDVHVWLHENELFSSQTPSHVHYSAFLPSFPLHEGFFTSFPAWWMNYFAYPPQPHPSLPPTPVELVTPSSARSLLHILLSHLPFQVFINIYKLVSPSGSGVNSYWYTNYQCPGQCLLWKGVLGNAVWVAACIRVKSRSLGSRDQGLNPGNTIYFLHDL